MTASSDCAVLFDLDGTLIDTAPDMAAAMNALRIEQNLDALPFATIRPFVSHGANALVRLGFPDTPDDEFAVLRERFLAIYRDCLSRDTVLFEGTAELLTALEESGIPWGIVTNKPTWLTEPLLEALALRARVVSLVCGDTFPERKPHPRPLLHAASVLGMAPEKCLYVGDAQRDIIAARAARMRPIIARFGYIGPQDNIDEWQADGCIDSPLEVLHWLDRRTQ